MLLLRFVIILLVTTFPSLSQQVCTENTLTPVITGSSGGTTTKYFDKTLESVKIYD